MLNVMKKTHTTLFIGPTDCGKTQLLLELLENEYRHHFEFIFAPAYGALISLLS